jgi:ABC-type oligopeptide transport system ATPase subunit
MVFQDPYSSLNPRKTIFECIGEALFYHKLVKNKEEQADKVATVLEQIGLSPDVMNRYPHEFSGGQQQRICIGRAIALNPKLIICDEAVSALDISIQAQILNLLIELKETLHLSYLFISHDLSVIKNIASRTVVLYKGKIVETGSTEQIFQDPQCEYTKELLSAIPRIHPRKMKTKSFI